MSESRFKTFNYAVGMFGTSIPINMLKTFAAAYYVIGLGLTTPQLSRILFIYAFIDAADNLVYGFLSDRTRTRWGRRKPWLVIATPLLAIGLILFYSTPAGLAGTSLFVWAMLFYILTGTIDSVINANYGALFPELFRTNESPGRRERHAAGVPARRDDHQHRPHPDGDEGHRVQPDVDRLRHPRRRRHPLHGPDQPGGGGPARGAEAPVSGTA